MRTTKFNIPSLILIFFSLSISCISLAAAYSPTDKIAVNCGATSNSTALDGREWTGDANSEYDFSRQQESASITKTALHDPASSVDPVPFFTARIFFSQFTYTFSVRPGQKFIRLYFYSASYPGYERSNAFFNVRVGPFTLLENFSASAASSHPLGFESFTREFCITVGINQKLNITFAPSPEIPDSYAFINGIEIVSMPNILYFSRFTGSGVPLVDHDKRLYIRNNSALETVYRLNVGGGSISPTNDSGMFRRWFEDTSYIQGGSVGVVTASKTITIKYSKVPPYTAPAQLYRSARSVGTNKNGSIGFEITWRLPVDTGFTYLVRLHFCEIESSKRKNRHGNFRIVINNQTAEDEADVLTWTGGTGIPIYRDYLVMMEGDGIRGKRDLFIALHKIAGKKSSAYKYDAFLNGLELFKLNNSVGSLAGPDPEKSIAPTPVELPDFIPKKRKIKRTLIFSMGGSVTVVIAVSVLSSTLLWCWSRRKSKSGSTLASKLERSEFNCRQFSLAELRMSTENFDRALIIGTGGFSRVYKGYIDGGGTAVAIKVFKSASDLEGIREFWTEVEMLSKLRHPNLTSLIGYCNDQRRMIIVYDYMPRGTLRDHLYGTDNPSLPWNKRLEICLGAARGLLYLHAGAKHKIIHRDIKTSNILLDDRWVARVSDFGLSRMGPTSVSCSHVTTEVKGTFGYLDPEYYWTHKLTEKSDVYSFGVVLFEVLCARAAVDMNLEYEQQSLAQWARDCVREGTIIDIVDPRLKGEIKPESLQVYVEIAEKCIREQRIERPGMADVIGALESAMGLQGDVDASEEDVKLEEKILFCRGGNQVVQRAAKGSEVIHSCPTFGQRSVSHKALYRFLSEKVGLQWGCSPTFRGLKLCFAVSGAEYNALRHVSEVGEVQMRTDEVASGIRREI